MLIWLFLGQTVFLALILFFSLFFISSLKDNEYKAAWLSATSGLGLIIIDVVLIFGLPSVRTEIMGALFVASCVFLAWVLISPKPRMSIEIRGEQRKVDERDVIFARFDLASGSKNYKEYYQRKPEFQPVDDEIRKLPDILSSSHFKKDPLLFSLAEAEFSFLEQLVPLVDEEQKGVNSGFSPEQNTLQVKKILRYLGAVVSGVCDTEQAYVYSHVGRGPSPYGQVVEMKHKYALSFAVEMDWDMISAAPSSPVIVETGKQYVKAARISIIAAQTIRRLGYPARAHIAGSNYQAMLTPLAWKAGLGELGRIGILMTQRFGPRIRLGLVTTDMPLIPDEPVVFGVQDFCYKCEKCAFNCPAQAISRGEKTLENGVLKWTLQREECYRFWRRCGTDCARCILVCPYSKTDSAFHKIVRKAAANSQAFQSMALIGDDIFYGRLPSQRRSPFSV